LEILEFIGEIHGQRIEIKKENIVSYSPSLKWLIPTIIILAFTATLAGLWPGEGQPYALTNFRGEEVTINAHGLYYWDTVDYLTHLSLVRL